MEKIGVELSIKGGDDFIGSLKSATKAIDDFTGAAKNIPKIDFGTPKLPDFSTLKIPNIAQEIQSKNSGGIDLTKTPIRFPDFVKETAQAATNVAKFVGGAVLEIGKIGLAATEAAGKFAVGFSVDSVKVFGDFESVMNTTTGVMDLNKEGVSKLTDQAIELGKKYPVSTKGVAQAQQELGKAGFDLNQTLEGTPAVLKLAMGANLDLGKAAGYSAGTLRGFGLNVKDLTHVTDVLNSTANASSVDISDLAQTFKYVAPAAKGAGFSFEDMSVASGLLGNNMIKGSQAGTSLRSIITRLTAPTKDSASAMETLGLKVTDANGKMRPFTEIVKEVRSKFQGLSEVDQIDLAKKLAGQEAMSSLLALVGSSDEDWNNMSKAIDGADGSTNKLVDTMNKGTKSSLDNLSGSVEALQIKIGSMLAPAINWAAGALSDFTNTVSDAFDKFSKGDIQGGLKTITDAIGGIGKTVMDAVPTIVSGLGSVLKGIIDWAIQAAPQILATVGGWAKSFVEWISPMIPGILQELGKIIVSIGGWIGEQIPGIVAQLGTWGSAFMQWIGPQIPGMLSELGKLAGQFFGWIGEQIPKVVEQVAKWGKEFVDWVGPQIPGMLSELGKLITQGLGWIGEQIPKIVEQLGKWGKEFYDWIGPQIGPMLNELGKFLGKITGWVIAHIPDIVGKLVEWGAAFVGWVATDVLPKLPGMLGDVLKAIITFAANALPDIVAKMTEWGAGMVLEIGKLVVSLPAKFKEAFDSVMKTLGDVGGNLLKWFGDLPGNIIKAVGDIGSTLLNAGKDLINGFIRGFQSIHIPFPHFTAGFTDQQFGPVTVPVPYVNVSWYKKGGIFNSPQMIGIGEAGGEAVLPLDKIVPLLSEAINISAPGLVQALPSLQQIASSSVYNSSTDQSVRNYNIYPKQSTSAVIMDIEQMRVKSYATT